MFDATLVWFSLVMLGGGAMFGFCVGYSLGWEANDREAAADIRALRERFAQVRKECGL